MTADRLAQLLAGEIAPTNDEERGALVLVALNYHMLKLEEEREHMAAVQRVAGELGMEWERDRRKAAGQAA